MINVSESIMIQKPVEDIFNYTTDLHNLPKWQKSIKSIEAPEGPATKGYQYINVRRFLGQDIKTAFEVLEVNKNSNFILKSKDGPVEIQVNLSFEPIGDATKMTTNLQAKVGGFFKVAEGMVAKQMQSQIIDDSNELKSLMEKM